ncbi:MAG: hypothetical protein P1U90_16285 [Akkermansiaceae bacterium]|nr:hypothetical protein [Akkermansiaceae bacterium]
MIKKLTPFLCLGVFALASCKDDETPPKSNEQAHQEELAHWQGRAEREVAARQAAESEKLSSVSRAQTLEKAVLVTGIAAVAFLFLGGAMGSKAKKDVLNS